MFCCLTAREVRGTILVEASLGPESHATQEKRKNKKWWPDLAAPSLLSPNRGRWTGQTLRLQPACGETKCYWKDFSGLTRPQTESDSEKKRRRKRQCREAKAYQALELKFHTLPRRRGICRKPAVSWCTKISDAILRTASPEVGTLDLWHKGSDRSSGPGRVTPFFEFFCESRTADSRIPTTPGVPPGK
jgi:hypothetical protein